VLVTVLMPVRDTPAWMLDLAIDSILNQTLRDFEFLIVDDGSRAEATLACLKRRASQDQRIRVEPTGGIGLTRALNCGLDRARGEWIARQDADDWSESGRLELQLDFLRANLEIELCGTAAWMHRRDGGVLWRSRPVRTNAEICAALWKENPFVHGSAVFRAARARSIGGYRVEFTASQDYDFFWRMAETAQAANLGEPLYHYRYSSGAVSACKGIEQARAHRAARLLGQARARGEAENVAAALGAALTPGEEFRAALKQTDHRMLAGEYGQAARAYAGLLWSHPASALAWGKMARWGIFVAVPPARELCFR